MVYEILYVFYISKSDCSFFVSSAIAGGEFSEGELLRLEQACSKENSGDACLVLAENTMCGRGFNAETAQLMNQAVVPIKQVV